MILQILTFVWKELLDSLLCENAHFYYLEEAENYEYKDLLWNFMENTLNKFAGKFCSTHSFFETFKVGLSFNRISLEVKNLNVRENYFFQRNVNLL